MNGVHRNGWIELLQLSRVVHVVRADDDDRKGNFVSLDRVVILVTAEGGFVLGVPVKVRHQSRDGEIE